MKALEALGISSVELEKIDKVAYKTFVELKALGELVESGLLDELTVKQYEIALRDFNNFIKSESFIEKAKDMGYGVKSKDDISIDIDISDIDFDLEGLTLDDLDLDDSDIELEDDEKEGVSKESVDVDELDLDELDLDESEEGEEEEEEKEEKGAEEVIDSDLFGYEWVISGGSMYGAIANLAVILSVSKSDNKIYHQEGANGSDYFMILLPNFFAKIIFSYPSDVNATDTVLSLTSLLEEAVKKRSKAYIVGANEELLEELIPLFDNSFYSDMLGLTDASLKKDIFDTEYYDELVNSKFDKAITGRTFSDNENNAVKIFKNLKSFEKDENLSSVSSELSPHYQYGVNYIDYCYIPVQYMYEKGGSFIQVNSTVYYSPNQLKDFSFYEVGTHLKSNTIDVSKFDRESGVVSKSSFKNQKKAYPLMSYNDFGTPSIFSKSRTYFYLENGKYVSVTALSIGYFKKYYGKNIEFLYSDEFLQIVQSGNVIGLIKTDGEKLSIPDKVELVYELDTVYSKLRSADSETFDFLRDVTEITGLSIIGLSDKSAMPEAKPEPTIEEVEEEVDEIDLDSLDLDDDVESDKEEVDADMQQIIDEYEAIKEMLEIFSEEDDPESYNQLKEELETLEMLKNL